MCRCYGKMAEKEIATDNFMETITMLKSKRGETYFG